jgi:hypothetical protein
MPCYILYKIQQENQIADARINSYSIGAYGNNTIHHPLLFFPWQKILNQCSQLHNEPFQMPKVPAPKSKILRLYV